MIALGFIVAVGLPLVVLAIAILWPNASPKIARWTRYASASKAKTARRTSPNRLVSGGLQERTSSLLTTPGMSTALGH
ncbi:hypothetical protein [Nocardia sp. NPDC019255]|uniref:hypothetical protein n=1 Tax=Nocardia sp. NPDC019255 TaxID=3154591 RepID=UPI0033DB1A01